MSCAPVMIPKGTQFGFYTTTSATPVSVKGNNHWEVRCICGTVKLCKGANLRSGRSNSCGCSAGDTISRKAVVRLSANPRTSSSSREPREPREAKAPMYPAKPTAAELTALAALPPDLRLALAMRKSGAKWGEVLELTGLTREQVQSLQP